MAKASTVWNQSRKRFSRSLLGTVIHEVTLFSVFWSADDREVEWQEQTERQVTWSSDQRHLNALKGSFSNIDKGCHGLD